MQPLVLFRAIKYSYCENKVLVLNGCFLIRYTRKEEHEVTMSEVRNGKKRILIVDDDPDITKTFGLVLEDSGLYEVDTYNDPSYCHAEF